MNEKYHAENIGATHVRIADHTTSVELLWIQDNLIIFFRGLGFPS